MNQQQNNRVATFFSSTGNAGTTNTVFSVALALSKRTTARIGVLCLNGWDDSSDYLDNPPTFLNDLKPRLAGKALRDNDEFLDRFSNIADSNLYILAGNRDRLLERIFTEEEIDYLIEKSKEIFDVILIDGGCHVDNALTAQSILASDAHYVVLTQQPKSLKRFRQLHDDFLKPLALDRDQFNYILNMYQEKTYLLTEKQIAKELDVSSVMTVPFSDDGSISELESKFLYSYNNPRYQESIDLLAELIGEDMNLQLTEKEKKKKKFFSFT